jgi:hypothetical protein
MRAHKRLPARLYNLLRCPLAPGWRVHTSNPSKASSAHHSDGNNMSFSLAGGWHRSRARACLVWCLSHHEQICFRPAKSLPDFFLAEFYLVIDLQRYAPKTVTYDYHFGGELSPGLSARHTDLAFHEGMNSNVYIRPLITTHQ